MRIAIVNKKGGQLAGNIRWTNIHHAAIIDFTYSTKSEVIKDIQEVLLKYYDLKYTSGESGKPPSVLVVDGVEIRKTKNRHGGKKIKTPVKKEGDNGSD